MKALSGLFVRYGDQIPRTSGWGSDEVRAVCAPQRFFPSAFHHLAIPSYPDTRVPPNRDAVAQARHGGDYNPPTLAVTAISNASIPDQELPALWATRSVPLSPDRQVQGFQFLPGQLSVLIGPDLTPIGQ